MYKHIALSLVCIATAACVTVSNVRMSDFRPACAYSDKSCVIGIKGNWDFERKNAGSGSGSIVDVLAMLSTQPYLTVTTNKVRFLPTSGVINVRLTFDATTVAQTTTTWYRSGNRLYLTDASTVRSWLEARADAANGVALDFLPMAIAIDGEDGETASVTFTAAVGGVTVASGTSAGIIEGTGGCRFGPCEVQ